MKAVTRFPRQLFPIIATLVGTFCLAATAVAEQSPAQEDIGIFTAVEGRITVTRPSIGAATAVKLQDTVLFRDTIETDKESRTKALLNDDSILTVGEHSRVEITEHLYDPTRNVRSVVVNLVQGKVRALVGKVFAGSGSKFEIHTPTAVAAARGTYFVVWHVDGASGIANIGNHGDVDFQSGGQTVRVNPGNFSMTPPGGGPPSPQAPATGGNIPSQVASAVQGTEVKDNHEESPSHTAQASGGTASVNSPTAQPAAPVAAAAPTNPSGSLPSTISTLITPPAVTSGAAPPPPSPPPPPPPPPPRFKPVPIDPVAIRPDNGLHLGQRDLQPGHGNPTPGNTKIPPGNAVQNQGKLK
jgi:hypothetical protein